MDEGTHREILEKSWETDRLLYESCQILKIRPKDLSKTCQRFRDMVEEQKKELERLR